MKLTKNDLMVFADIGSKFDETSDEVSTTWQFHMSAEFVSINVPKDESFPIVMQLRGCEQRHLNGRSLLASEPFGDLKHWARNQRMLLKGILPDDPIETSGEFVEDTSKRSSGVEGGLQEFESQLIEFQGKYALHAVVVDGPAGIGKTMLIQRLASLRAASFPTDHGRLVLHIESRGRVLQNITDLISASLHTLRVNVTCEQLLVLARHGLIVLAIDGFDELADPNGYQMAWSQLNEILAQVSGDGQVVLSGRETFVSPGRMKKSLGVLSSTEALLSEYTMKDVSVAAAKVWLVSKGWSPESIESEKLSEMLTVGSYSARPFFLKELSDPEMFKKVSSGEAVDMLPILVNALIEREVDKFGQDVRKTLGVAKIEKYLNDVNDELARDMADNQGEVLPSQTVSYISEICIPDDVDDKVRRILIHRAQTLPFLTRSEGQNSLRFSHRQYFVFFLGRNAIEAVADGEIPKYLRHNLLGAEFLESFDKVCRGTSSNLVQLFQTKCQLFLEEPNVMDRSAGNLASLMLTSACSFPFKERFAITGISIDELLISSEIENVDLNGVAVSSLYAENSNLAGLSFSSDSHVISLHSNDQTQLPASFPIPSWIEAPGQTISNPSAVEAHVEKLKGERLNFTFQVKLPFNPRLIRRIITYRSFWLKLESGNDEHVVQRILQDHDWDRCYQWLKDNELVRVEDRSGFAGKTGTFIHFRKSLIAEQIMKGFDTRKVLI